MEIIPEFKLTQDLNKAKIEQVEKEKIESKLIGKILRTPGLQLFMFNFKTLELAEVNADKMVLWKVIKGKPTLITQQKALINPTEWIPFEALNEKTATKRVELALKGKKPLCNLKIPGKGLLRY